MFRGATARTVVSALAAVLITLQLFTPSAVFASAHTARHVEAKAQLGIQPSEKARARAPNSLQRRCATGLSTVAAPAAGARPVPCASGTGSVPRTPHLKTGAAVAEARPVGGTRAGRTR